MISCFPLQAYSVPAPCPPNPPRWGGAGWIEDPSEDLREFYLCLLLTPPPLRDGAKMIMFDHTFCPICPFEGFGQNIRMEKIHMIYYRLAQLIDE